MATTHSKGGKVKVDGLRKRTAMACFEAAVEVAVCSEARNETPTCSEARIEDGRQRQHRRQAAAAQRFLGRQKSKRERGVKKMLSVARESVGPKILG
jgi:hypothetical protein